MDLLGQDGSIQQTWPFFYDWKNTNRRLVVIDEALDIVEHSQAALEGLRLTEATLSQSIRTRFTLEVQCLNEVIEILDTYEKRTRKEKVKEHRILEDLIKGETFPDFTALRQVMRKEIRYDQQSGKHDNIEQQRLREIHDSRIRDLNNIVNHGSTMLIPSISQLSIRQDCWYQTTFRELSFSMLQPAVMFSMSCLMQMLSLLLMDHVTTRM